MFLSKVKFVMAAIVATGVLVAGIGNGSMLLRADQEKPVKPGAGEQKPEKPVKPGTDPAKPGEKPAKPGEKPAKPEGVVKSPAISGTLKAIDADKRAITVSITSKGGGTRDEAVTLDKDAKVFLDGKEAKLGDLKTGLPVSVKFNPDRTLALGVSTEGPTWTGELKSIDAAKHSLVLKITTHPDPTDKTKTGSEEKTLKVADNARVAIDGNKNATLADIKEGSTVSVRTAADGGQVLMITPLVKKGPAVTGELKEVAADGKSLKLAVVVFAIKGDKNSAKTEEKTIKLADDVKVMVDGKKQSALSELKAGSTVAIEMSLDGEKAVAIKSQSKGEKKPEKPGEKPVKPVKPGTEKSGEKPGAVKPVKP